MSRAAADGTVALREWRACRRRVLDRGARRGDVHDWRVATRRLRAAAEAGLPKRAAAKLDELLEASFDAAGELRDAQLGALLARDLGDGQPCALALAKWLRGRVPKLRRRLLRRLRALQPGDVRRVLSQGRRGEARAAQAGASRIPRPLADGLRAVDDERGLLDLRSPPNALHRLRLAVKAACYLAERAAAQPGAPPLASVTARLARSQRALGAVADLGVLLEQFEAFARRHPERARGGAAFARGLRRRQRALARGALQRHPLRCAPRLVLEED